MAQDTGVLPDREIEALVASGAIRTDTPLDEGQVQPASLDLRLAEDAYRLRASFLPGKDRTVAEMLQEPGIHLHRIDLTQEGAVLETGCVYIVPLMETLALPQDVSATTNPKSSTGRLDVFTRVITDEGRAFDTVPAGYRGPLYAEISPRTFPVLVREGSRLSQIRFRIGDPFVSDRQPDREGPNRAGGLGLGLFIAKTLLERAGATLTFENDDGARITITWPRWRMETE